MLTPLAARAENTDLILSVGPGVVDLIESGVVTLGVPAAGFDEPVFWPEMPLSRGGQGSASMVSSPLPRRGPQTILVTELPWIEVQPRPTYRCSPCRWWIRPSCRRFCRSVHHPAMACCGHAGTRRALLLLLGLGGLLAAATGEGHGGHRTDRSLLPLQCPCHLRRRPPSLHLSWSTRCLRHQPRFRRR